MIGGGKMSSELNKIPIVVIGGPTAVGKTALSIEMAKAFNGEIINGDSLQVYRKLNIGTGKVTRDEMEGIPHHLLDILNPDESFDASKFKELATQAILEIHQRGKLPIIVGGTGLYLEGLLYGLGFGGNKSEDEQIRKALENQAATMSENDFWELLNQKDPTAAQKIPPQNTRRIIRALEVIATTGKLFSEQEEHQVQTKVFDSCLLVLDMPREQLYERINQRVDLMIEQGLETEVKQMYQQFDGELVNGMKGIGYKEWWAYFEGHLSQETVINHIKQNSRRYAKRQLTWFRNRLKDAHWIDARQSWQEAQPLIAAHLKKERNTQ